ncbi:hypothetical protein ES708_27276 [subsurface metagenome]
MNKLIIGLIAVGTVLLAVGIATGITGLAVAGAILLGVGVLLIKLMG